MRYLIPTKISRNRAALVLLALVCWPSAAALAQPKKDSGAVSEADLERLAQEHFERGRSYYAAGDFKEALVEFEAANRILPSPLLRMNIGYALWGLGRTEDAKREFRRFYRTAEDTSQRETALSAMQALDPAIDADGLTPRARTLLHAAVITSGAAAAVGVVTGAIAAEQALIEGRRGFDRPEGLLIATEAAFGLSAVAALSGVAIVRLQRGTTAEPPTLFAAPGGAALSIKF